MSTDLTGLARSLKERAKELGYDLKHTHALELLATIEGHRNRHVLKQSLKEPIEHDPEGIYKILKEDDFYSLSKERLKELSGKGIVTDSCSFTSTIHPEIFYSDKKSKDILKLSFGVGDEMSLSPEEKEAIEFGFGAYFYTDGTVLNERFMFTPEKDFEGIDKFRIVKVEFCFQDNNSMTTVLYHTVPIK